MVRRGVVASWSTLLLVALAGSARADVVHLKNGSRIEGEVEVAADGVRVKLAYGSVFLPSKEVASIERIARAPAPAPVAAAAPVAPAPVARVAPVARIPSAEDAQVAARAREVEGAFERGDQAAASTLMASSSIRRFDETSDLVDVSAEYDGQLSLTIRRNRATGPIAVAFPPGTYGEPRGRSVQDLTILRAPVLVLPADASEATVRVPVACAKYSAQGPSGGQAYTLTRYASGSPMERLMEVLCIGERAPAPEEAQLAVWIVANGIRPTDLCHAHSFGGGMVTEAHTPAALSMMRSAALSPDDFAFFNRSVEAVVEPTGPVPVRPQVDCELELLEVPEFPAPVLPPPGPVAP